MQTKQLKLAQLNSDITERTQYLRTIEEQIEEVSNAANNKLFNLQGEIDEAEKKLALVLKRSYEIEQNNRERLAQT